MAVKRFTKRNRKSRNRKTRKQIKHRKQQGGGIGDITEFAKTDMLPILEREVRLMQSTLEIIIPGGKAWYIYKGKDVTSKDIPEVKQDIALKNQQIAKLKELIKQNNSTYGSVSELNNS